MFRSGAAGHAAERERAAPAGIARLLRLGDDHDDGAVPRVALKLNPANRRSAARTFESPLDAKIQIDHSSWVAVRCFEDRADKRVRFAHTGPCHVEVAG